MEVNKINDIRVLFVVDAASLLYSARDRFGERSRIDFVKILNKARRVSSERPALFIPTVYLFDSQEGGGKSSLVAYLERIGFGVIVGEFNSSTEGRHQSDYRVSEIVKSVTQRLSRDRKEFTRVVFASNQSKIIDYAIGLGSQQEYGVHLFSFGGSAVLESSNVGYHPLTSEVVFSDFKK